MNAPDLISEIIDIVDSEPYDFRDLILKYLNQSIVSVSETLLLPDLADGHEVVTTAINGYSAPLPDDYHKGLFLANVDGKEIDIHKDLKTLSMMMGTVSAGKTGDVAGVAVNGKNLIYQSVPSAAVDIELFYYRRPGVVEDKKTSFPEGLANNDDFDWCLIHKACSKIFNKIEDGIEGAKVNTNKHEAQFNERLANLDVYAYREGISFPVRPACNLRWLG